VGCDIFGIEKGIVTSIIVDSYECSNAEKVVFCAHGVFVVSSSSTAVIAVSTILTVAVLGVGRHGD
jgi:hypothetical protein